MKICEPKRNEDSEQCRMLHNKELSDLCMSHGVGMVKCRRLLAGCLVRIGEPRHVLGILVGKLQEYSVDKGDGVIT
jgi:hypothetical protein